MNKDSTYQEKFAILKKWMPQIINAIKKDLKNEHIKKDGGFVREYLSAKNINKLTTEDLAEAYSNAIAKGENAENLGEFLTNRWLLKNSEIYQHFETELTKISPNFSDLEELDKESSVTIMQSAVAKFGAPKTYLFSVLNSVVFPKEIFDQLSTLAQKEVTAEEEEEAIQYEKSSFESMQRSYEQQMARLKDKYEKKILGLEKKYLQDTESLKKQLAALQRKLNPQ